jgi:hypothetical protein
MGYVPQFRNDLFISYRHVSNDGQDKWVDAFCDQLRVHLAELVGEIAIWRDSAEIRAGDRWRKEIAEALDSTAIFLAIVTGTYFDSDVCRTELDQFLGRIKRADAAVQQRLVPVFKQPPGPDQSLPPELGEFDHHRFFEFRPKGSTHFQEFRPGEREETAPLFASTLAALAQDLREALQMLKGIARAQAIGTIYLAEVGPELHAEREKLRTDLQQRGYLVVPERRYFWNASNFAETIARDLDAAQLCIHQIARTASIDSTILDRSQRQLDLAVQAMARRQAPPPLVWVQPADVTDPGAQKLVDYVERNLSNRGVEYSEGTLEDFKTQIYDTLAKRASPTESHVAVIVEDDDLAASGDLLELLAARLNVEPRRIRFTGSNPRDASSLAKTLARCRHCIILWGSRPEEWIADLLARDSIAGFAGCQRLCVYVGHPPSAEKDTFRSSKAHLVRSSAASPEAQLGEFLGRAKDGR